MAAKVDELFEMQKMEEKRLQQQIRAVGEMKKAMFKKNQELFDLRNQERDLIAEIAGGQAQNKNLVGNISRLDGQVVKQQELLYNSEFQVQQLERKVQRAAGERTDDEKRALNARIEKLTGQLEGVNAEHSMLSEQVKLVEDALTKARRTYNNLKSDDKQIQDKIHEQRLVSDSSTRELERAIKTKEDKMVEHDMLKLEVERLRGILNLKADEVFSLENRKFQLQQSMEERKQEVTVHVDSLKTELRFVRDDIHRITLELKEREMKIDKLQAKYDTLANKQKAEEGEEVTQAYYVIKAAQQREELQRKGDDLDAKIRKAEKEVRALEKSLDKLGIKNTQYARSFKKVDDKQGYEERANLRQKLDRAYDRLKFKRNEEKNIAGDIEASEMRLQNLDQEQMHLEARMNDLEHSRSDAESALRDQNEKSQRAARRLQKLRSEMRVALGVSAMDTPAEEVDMQLAEVREINSAMLEELRMLAEEAPGVDVGGTLREVGLDLPRGLVGARGGPTGSRTPSRASSVASESSSVRSARGRAGTVQIR
mmetsp:Transcript_4386/g.10991  ORF Transcript_4386/g.10991 Transcript_4386/m.10991 type:complete len:540 (-) Transcript_4386:72-1691(-)